MHVVVKLLRVGFYSVAHLCRAPEKVEDMIDSRRCFGMTVKNDVLLVERHVVSSMNTICECVTCV